MGRVAVFFYDLKKNVKSLNMLAVGQMLFYSD